LRNLFLVAYLSTLSMAALAATSAEVSGEASSYQERFAGLALACVHQENPNKIAHVMSSDEDVGPPRELTPVFFGCFDWHSSVHGHWLLVRLLRLYPNAEFAAQAEAALEKSFHPDKIARELEYISHDQRASFERPYGVAWLLQLMAELREWDDPRAQRWKAMLEPLESAYVVRMRDWLSKLAYPIRTGEHAQTAFAFALFIDWARVAGDTAFEAMVVERSLAFYRDDVDCPMAYEPGGQDFLSPCLAEADLMRRVQTSQEYAQWLWKFLPGIAVNPESRWLPLAEVTDLIDKLSAALKGVDRMLIVSTDAFGERRRLYRLQGVEHDEQPALHVRAARRVQRVVVEIARFLKRMVGGKHRVHVAGQQNPDRRLRALDEPDAAAERALDDLARRGDDGLGLGGDRLGAPEVGKAFLQRRAHPRQPFEIVAAGIDRAPLFEGRNHLAPPAVDKRQSPGNVCFRGHMAATPSLPARAPQGGPGGRCPRRENLSIVRAPDRAQGRASSQQTYIKEPNFPSCFAL